MKLVEQSFEILEPGPSIANRYATYRAIVERAKVSYHADIDEPTEVTVDNLQDTVNRYGKFIRRRIQEGHESVLEHAYMGIKFITNRAIANELTRHRLVGWTQESTRYCNYSSGRFGSEIQFVYSPYFVVGTAGFDSFVDACEKAEKEYFALLNIGYTPEQARDVLPLATKTTLVGTANLREWRHIFSLRADESTGKVHPMMKKLMTSCLLEAKQLLPDVFFDIKGGDTTEALVHYETPRHSGRYPWGKGGKSIEEDRSESS